MPRAPPARPGGCQSASIAAWPGAPAGLKRCAGSSNTRRDIPAERAFALELGLAHHRASGLQNALARAFRSASEDARLGVLTAHPDLAGRLAETQRLTADSAAEQSSAGLDALTDAEHARFIELNAACTKRFGFPIIIAVRDHDKAGILAVFECRLTHDRDIEFRETCNQVERIARLRLDVLLPD